jgi:hypothetical protein
MSNRIGRLAKLGWFGAIIVLLTGASAAPGQARLAGQARHESIARKGGDGEAVYGRVTGDAKQGFRFTLIGGEPAIPLEEAGVVTFDGPGADASSGYPPMRVLLGLDQQLSGRLGSVDDRSIKLEVGPGASSVAVSRGGAIALTQRPSEALVLQEGFEGLDPARWSHVGEPEIVDEPKIWGSKSLSLPAGGSAVTCRLAEPVTSGRLEVAFHDPGTIVAGQQWFVDLLFRGPGGDEWVKMVLDAAEESLAVLSSGEHALAVQRLARKPGWRRLGVRFGPETELAVDGDELAHGRGRGGPLVEIRLANQTTGNAEPPKGLSVHFDDLRLVRLAEPVGGLEVAPQVDDVRIVDGDQVFGRLRSADADAASMLVDTREVSLPWTEVASIRFRRPAEPSRPIEGLLVRLEWRSSPGNDPRDLDQVEGALLSVSDAAFTLATPYSGDLTIPRDRLRRLKVLGSGRRIVLDPSSHHLGNEVSKEPQMLDPPWPEGGTLERTFTLGQVPEGTDAFLVLDVVQVVGEANSPFSELVRGGQIRTNVRINDRQFDYLNRHITTRNETPDRIRLPIPAGLLRPGENRLKIEQVGKVNDPEELDDLGILTIAVEFSMARP